jgi:aryl-alcohol dehydrogenase-like predicted oxidoreductase
MAGSIMGDGPNDSGSSRRHLIKSCEDSLSRLGTDYIDIYYIHEFDATTPIEETLCALDDLVRGGKVRYIACSNFSGWHLMKSLAISEKYGWARYVAHQAHYSLASREYEWELMPLALDQKVATVVYGALAGAALTGKVRRNQPIPEDSRLSKDKYGMAGPPEFIYKIVDVMDEVAEETGKTISQIAINWLLARPTVSSVIMGARNEEQLKDNLGAAGWNLTGEQISKLDAASEKTQIYPYSHQRHFPMLNPPPIPRR